jgi:hypothetical protein
LRDRPVAAVYGRRGLARLNLVEDRASPYISIMETSVEKLVAIIGWGLVIKSNIYFTCPRQGVRMLGTTSLERSWHFVAAGVTSVAVSGLILYPLL